MFGADLDAERVKTCEERDWLDGSRIIEADCDEFPFPDLAFGLDDQVAVADFDSYAYPYASFRSWWEADCRTDPVVVFFTDGEKQPLMRTGGHFIAPDGEHRHIVDLQERRRIFNSYLSRTVWPWLEGYVAPWHLVHRFRYSRGWMAYHGAVLSRSRALA